MFTKVTIDVSKKVNGAFSKVGEATISVPTLQECVKFITSDIKKDEKGADVVEDGLPVYTADEANWIQGAILAAVKAQARNKLVSGTATVKDGLKIAEDWAELCAEGVRDGSGLALARDFKEAFKEFISKQNLAENAANTLVTLVSNKAALALQTESTKKKVEARLTAFAESLDAATLEKFMRPMDAAVASCQVGADPLDGI